jgi:HSP20 family molecular chaperone IbpA
MTTAAQAAGEAGAAVQRVAPRVDIYETDAMYVLIADMPGVTPDGVDVVAERNSLVVRGRIDHPATTPDYQEFTPADYYRAFTLTDDLDTDRMTATLRDGVLRVDIPKSERVQPKKIPVRAD